MNRLSSTADGDSSAMGRDWLLWQLGDSAFPMGAFGHSGGLEAAWQQGEVRGGEGLEDFLEASMIQLGSGALPFVQAAWAGEQPLAELDARCDAFFSGHVANRASRAQGQALLASTARAFPVPRLRSLRQGVIEGEQPGHWPVMFGAVGSILGLDAGSAAHLFLFMHARGIVSAAVRLGVVGPLEGQSIQYQGLGVVNRVLRRAKECGVAGVAQTAPLMEIFQGTQDRLYSRLFQS